MVRNARWVLLAFDSMAMSRLTCLLTPCRTPPSPGVLPTVDAVTVSNRATLHLLVSLTYRLMVARTVLTLDPPTDLLLPIHRTSCIADPASVLGLGCVLGVVLMTSTRTAPELTLSMFN